MSIQPNRINESSRPFIRNFQPFVGCSAPASVCDWYRTLQGGHMKTKAMTSILALAVLTVTVALAQERFDMLVRQDFFAGFNGNREALERGMKITEDTLAKDPNHAEARVWHGSGILYLSGQAFQKGDQQNG